MTQRDPNVGNHTLSPCPFCKGRCEVLTQAYIHCYDCKMGFTLNDSNSGTQIATAFNRRD